LRSRWRFGLRWETVLTRICGHSPHLLHSSVRIIAASAHGSAAGSIIVLLIGACTCVRRLRIRCASDEICVGRGKGVNHGAGSINTSIYSWYTADGWSPVRCTCQGDAIHETCTNTQFLSVARVKQHGSVAKLKTERQRIGTPARTTRGVGMGAIRKSGRRA
jgi:hypothetical protein